MTPDLRAHLTDLRHALHRQPELSGAEAQTAAHMRAALAPLAPDALITGLGGHGLAAIFRGAAPTRRIMLRCELDALPIPDQGDVAYRSEVPGKGHLCGHDGHMAILLGVAHALSAQRIAGLEVVLLFQPAEETGAGAKAVIEDPAFVQIRPDASIALHNMPGIPLGQVQCRAGAFACASRGLRITLRGKTAHASMPSDGCSPGPAMAALMQAIPALNAPAAPGALPRQMATLTHARLGEPTYGVAPGLGEIRATLRSVTDADMDALCAKAEAAARTQAQTHGLGVELTYEEIFLACENHPGLAALIEKSARAQGIDFAPQALPMRPSEDFGRFGHDAPAAMLLLGAGDGPALHNPDYDFPDALIPIGTGLFLQILDHICARGNQPLDDSAPAH